MVKVPLAVAGRWLRFCIYFLLIVYCTRWTWLRGAANTQCGCEHDFLTDKFATILQALEETQRGARAHFVGWLNDCGQGDSTQRGPGHLIVTDQGNVVGYTQLALVECIHSA